MKVTNRMALLTKNLAYGSALPRWTYDHRDLAPSEALSSTTGVDATSLHWLTAFPPKAMFSVYRVNTSRS